MAETVYLTKAERLMLRLGVKSCLNCGYLSEHYEHQEVSRNDRQGWQTQEVTYWVRFAHCYRQVWDNHSRIDEPEQNRNFSKPRFCGYFYPYSEGSPESHRDSHRSRTNRRWLVAGGLLGPYIATATGIAASTLSRPEPFPPSLAIGLGTAFVGLVLVAAIINLVMNRV
jgi:hypothetical protein